MEELGVKTLQTPQDVVQFADVTFSCVSDPSAAKNVSFLLKNKNNVFKIEKKNVHQMLFQISDCFW